MRSLCKAIDGNHVAFGNHQLGSELQVRDAGAKHPKKTLKPFAPFSELWRHIWIVVRTVHGYQAVSSVKIAAVHYFVKQLLEILFISLLRRHLISFPELYS